MQAGKRYPFIQTLNWTRKKLYLFILFDTSVVCIYYFCDFDWMIIPWEPISLVGIATAFYLGFKNNSSYERLWEARKIWGGIVNNSRTFGVTVRDFIKKEESEEELKVIHKRLIYRHIAWLRAMTLQLRELKEWEHKTGYDMEFRKMLGIQTGEINFDELKKYLSSEEFQYLMQKGNKASHILSLQSKDLKKLKEGGYIDTFEHIKLQDLIQEMYELQGKSERIKNFPFPRQYASANYYIVVIFIVLLPFSILRAFDDLPHEHMIWLAIPFAVVVSWVFWLMESMGEYSENPFEGLYNDVPITAISRSIERDILQMIEEEDLPEEIQPATKYKILY
ncbi:MAG: multidrug transporter [Crocinitomicaceae bacterium]|nr:multidrug transporter [Crocinitomicaceae bacterium]